MQKAVITDNYGKEVKSLFYLETVDTADIIKDCKKLYPECGLTIQHVEDTTALQEEPAKVFEKEKEELKDALLDAVLSGNEGAVEAAKKQYAELLQSYNEALKDIKEGANA